MRVEFHNSAREEFRLAIEYYEAQRPMLGAAFCDSVGEVIASIASDPDRFPKAGRRMRRAVVRRCPHCVFYAVDGETIYIVAIAHASRRPGYWRGRLG